MYSPHHASSTIMVSLIHINISFSKCGLYGLACKEMSPHRYRTHGQGGVAFVLGSRRVGLV